MTLSPPSFSATCRSGIRTVPHNAKVHYNYANFLKDSARDEEAIHHYRIALEYVSLSSFFLFFLSLPPSLPFPPSPFPPYFISFFLSLSLSLSFPLVRERHCICSLPSKFVQACSTFSNFSCTIVCCQISCASLVTPQQLAYITHQCWKSVCSFIAMCSCVCVAMMGTAVTGTSGVYCLFSHWHCDGILQRVLGTGGNEMLISPPTKRSQWEANCGPFLRGCWYPVHAGDGSPWQVEAAVRCPRQLSSFPYWHCLREAFVFGMQFVAFRSK